MKFKKLMLRGRRLRKLEQNRKKLSEKAAARAVLSQSESFTVSRKKGGADELRDMFEGPPDAETPPHTEDDAQAPEETQDVYEFIPF